MRRFLGSDAGFALFEYALVIAFVGIVLATLPAVVDGARSTTAGRVNADLMRELAIRPDGAKPAPENPESPSAVPHPSMPEGVDPGRGVNILPVQLRQACGDVDDREQWRQRTD